MAAKIIFIFILVFSIGLLFSCKTTVLFTSSEQDANIFVDNKKIGSAEVVKVKKNKCVSVKVEKQGYITDNSTYCYNGTNLFKPKRKNIFLLKDDTYDASVKNDYANKDFEQEVNKKYSEEEAWKIISQIITSYFDNIEMADKQTGYLKTSWETQSFRLITIRTRVILKQSSLDPLKYKIKIISEYADDPNQSIKDDDKFKPWDRVLKKYEGLITEFQSRIGIK